MKIVPAEIDRGRTECESDIARGRLQFYWGTRGAWGEYMTTLMEERFGVRVIHIGCMTTDAQMSFGNGYNERMSEHINSTFGDESIENALADVKAYRTRRYHEHFGDGK